MLEYSEYVVVRRYKILDAIDEGLFQLKPRLAYVSLSLKNYRNYVKIHPLHRKYEVYKVAVYSST